MRKIHAPLATIVAIVVGFIVLLGYFIYHPILQNIRAVLLGWSVILIGVATLIGVLNLLVVHWRKIIVNPKKDYYSPFLLLAFFITFIAGLWLGPADSLFQKFVTVVQVPVETTLLAVMAITLAYTCLRLLQRRRDMMMYIFIISTIIFLLTGSAFLIIADKFPIINVFLTILNRLPLAGARGILLGIAIGTLVTGLRILLGFNRPYSG